MIAGKSGQKGTGECDFNWVRTFKIRCPVSGPATVYHYPVYNFQNDLALQPSTFALYVKLSAQGFWEPCLSCISLTAVHISKAGSNLYLKKLVAHKKKYGTMTTMGKK